MEPFLILGAGYTGERVARILEAAGEVVMRIRSGDLDLSQPESVSRLESIAPDNCVVLHSIPSLPERADAKLLEALKGKARRIVYLSTTGVYGAARDVDEHTAIAPRSERELARAATEAAVRSGPWESLILRPAAIYGPDRGVHVAMAEGRYKLAGDGSNFISRIHVEDLARLSAAALRSSVTGAYPVADEHPCSSREIAEYCAEHFHLPPPVRGGEGEVPVSRQGNRRVDGRAIFRLLGVRLLYPSYVEGFTANLI